MKLDPFYGFVIAYGLIGTLAFSSGAERENAGAPGESTCAQSGCHSSAQGSGGITVSLGSGSYVPGGPIMEITVQVNEVGANLRGFQLTVLDSNDKYVGTLSTLGADTRFAGGSKSTFPDRQYLTHTIAGTSQSQWVVGWTPPATDVGAVTFYAAGASSLGKPVYRTAVGFASNVGVESPSFETSLHVSAGHPNPAHQTIAFDIQTDDARDVRVNVRDVLGRTVYSRVVRVIDVNGKVNLDVAKLAAGTYFVQFASDSESEFRTIAVVH